MPQHDFTRLSPQDFEELVRDLLQVEWNVRLEAFKSGRDQGIDLRYAPAHGGKTIIQCKHFATSGFTKLVAHLKKTELPKVRALKPERYVIAATIGLTPANKDAVTEVMQPFVRQPGDILGRDDIESLLSRYPHVEQANFKLWLTSTDVIARVLHNAEQCHTDFEVGRVLEKLPLFVQSAAYPRAQEILSANRVLVISGVPGIGKTTLAEMLLYAHLEQGYEPVVVQSDIKEGRKLFRKDRKQIFYFDDFLGQTFLREKRESAGMNQDAALIDFIQMVSRTESSRFILTTREHLLQSAVEASERLRHSTLLDHKCILDLKDYSTRQRARILYNHLFFSDLPRAYKEQILRDDFFLKIIKHEHFSPRLIEWMSASERLRNVPSAAYQKHVQGLLADPRAIWSYAFNQQLSQGAQTLLLTLYSLGGWTDLTELEPAWSALYAHRARKYNFTTDPRDFTHSSKELDNAFLSYRRGYADFLNPSVKEFIAAEVSTYSEHGLDIVSSAVRSKQIAVICELARELKNTPLLHALSTQVVPLIENMKRLMYTDHLRWGYNDDGKYVGTYIDLTPEWKLVSVAKMAEALKSEPLFQYLSLEVAVRIKVFRKTLDHSNVADLILSFEDLPWLLGNGGRKLQRDLLTAMLADLRHINSQHLLSLLDCQKKAGCWTGADTVLLQAAIDEYRRHEVQAEIDEANDEDDLETLRIELEALQEKLDISFATDIEKVNEKIAELPEKPPPARGSGLTLPRPVTSIGDSFDDSDDSLRALFGNLLEPD